MSAILASLVPGLGTGSLVTLATHVAVRLKARRVGKNVGEVVNARLRQTCLALDEIVDLATAA
jgi:hypothetical protein